ncbi:MAG: sialidase family protein [Armatimonadota bacterium]
MQQPISAVALSVSVLLLAVSLTPAQPPWEHVFRDGVWHPATTAWVGEATRSELTDEGLLVVDPSTEDGSGRCYHLDWQADPAETAAVEASVRVVSCSAPYGVGILAANGVYEETATLYPDRVELVNAGQSAPFDAAGQFHTYRLEIVSQDVRLYADGEVLIDGAGQLTSPALGSPPRNRCSFGCMSSRATGEAAWKWVRCRPAPPLTEPQITVEGGEHLEIEVGETVEIKPGHRRVMLHQLRDGTLAVSDRRSHDGGRTWEQEGESLGANAFEFPDGEIISLGFLTERIGDGLFSTVLRRSTDGGRTFESETAMLSIPRGTGGVSDQGDRVEGPAIDHAVIQLADGSLLAAMYGQFAGDEVLVPNFPPEWQMYKYRTFVVRSTDRGRTWDYLSTVAYDPEIGLESFCEADLLPLPDGQILCFMRTGGSRGHYTPLYLSTSTDDGRTWSEPRPIADRGVWPNACRMQSGVLAVTYGRPGNWLAFSLDGGDTWVDHTCFHTGSSTSYNSVVEVQPGRLLVGYDRMHLTRNGDMAVQAVGTFFDVQPR